MRTLLVKWVQLLQLDLIKFRPPLALFSEHAPLRRRVFSTRHSSKSSARWFLFPRVFMGAAQQARGCQLATAHFTESKKQARAFFAILGARAKKNRMNIESFSEILQIRENSAQNWTIFAIFWPSWAIFRRHFFRPLPIFF